jgi:hypothetical protein
LINQASLRRFMLARESYATPRMAM